LQIIATTVIAQNTGSAIAGAIDAAISEGFSGSLVTPNGGGIRFNFVDADQPQVATVAGILRA
jgi:hypothetical protein